MRLTDLSFEDWLEHAFGHEVRFQRSPWFFDPDGDWWDPAPGEAVAYLTRLFGDPEPALRRFSDGQIAQGLTYLVDTSASGDNGWLYATSVPIEHRLRGASRRWARSSPGCSPRAARRTCRTWTRRVPAR